MEKTISEEEVAIRRGFETPIERGSHAWLDTPVFDSEAPVFDSRKRPCLIGRFPFR